MTNTAVYDRNTTSMQAGSEVSPGGASELSAFCGDAACAQSSQEWVPVHEQAQVPTDLMSTCRACPSRGQCLQWAVTGDEYGYWAGTTRADRQVMVQLGRWDIDTAEQLQAQARARQVCPAPLHTEGQASQAWYRRGCRCRDCKQAHAHTRARERQRARAAA